MPMCVGGRRDTTPVAALSTRWPTRTVRLEHTVARRHHCTMVLIAAADFSSSDGVGAGEPHQRAIDLPGRFWCHGAFIGGTHADAQFVASAATLAREWRDRGRVSRAPDQRARATRKLAERRAQDSVRAHRPDAGRLGHAAAAPYQVVAAITARLLQLHA